MNHPPILIRSISQKDNHTFTIHWSDGDLADYRLSDVQMVCPCAKCHQQKIDTKSPITPDYNVKATRITNVGRYALKIKFTSGCSNGIYSFASLRKLKEENLHANK